jgi:hypothetical protein
VAGIAGRAGLRGGPLDEAPIPGLRGEQQVERGLEDLLRAALGVRLGERGAGGVELGEEAA